MLQTKTESPLKQILQYGQSIWFDGLIAVKDFERLIQEDGLRGATTNPTIFEKALSHEDYDAEIARLVSSGDSAEEIYKVLTVKAVQDVCDVFSGIYRQTQGEDGFVSIEVSPLWARDAARTIEEARELWRRVACPNVMIKVPATKEGIPAIETLISEGMNVNVTLIFSTARYREVMEAYLRGIEKRLKSGQPVKATSSVASFFVSRVDTAVDKLLEEKKAPQPFLGKAAIANSKIAYEAFEEIFHSKRFEELKSRGARFQRPLWASTSTKNPKYSDVLYVEALIGPHTVNTLPPAAMDAFRDHGRAAAILMEKRQEAHRVLEDLKKIGIDMEDVTQKLESAGVEAFSDSYRKIIALIKERMQHVRAD